MMCHSSASVRICKLSASWMVKAVVQVALQNWIIFRILHKPRPRPGRVYYIRLPLSLQRSAPRERYFILGVKSLLTRGTGWTFRCLDDILGFSHSHFLGPLAEIHHSNIPGMTTCKNLPSNHICHLWYSKISHLFIYLQKEDFLTFQVKVLGILEMADVFGGQISAWVPAYESN